MKIIELNESILNAKYPSWIAHFCGADFNMTHDQTNYKLDQKYDLEFKLKRRLSDTGCNYIEYFRRTCSGAYPRILVNKCNERNIFSIVCRESSISGIVSDNLVLCIRDLVQMCELNSVAYLAIPDLDISNISHNEFIYSIISNEFANSNIEISIYNDNIKLPEKVFKPAYLTEDVHDIPNSGPIINDNNENIFNDYHINNHHYRHTHDHHGPYPEFNYDESKSIIQNTNDFIEYEEYTQANLKDKFCRSKKDYYPEMNGYPQSREYVEIHQDPPYGHNWERVSDAIKRFECTNISSHAYKFEDMINDNTYYNDYEKCRNYNELAHKVHVYNNKTEYLTVNLVTNENTLSLNSMVNNLNDKIDSLQNNITELKEDIKHDQIILLDI